MKKVKRKLPEKPYKESKLNGTGDLKTMGTIYCAEDVCEKPIAWFPSLCVIEEGIELYCYDCAKTYEEREGGDH